MFGYVSADITRLTVDDRRVYRGAYCGLCNSLGKRHGTHARLTLNYDMTFLALILSSVYGVDFEEKKLRCPAHPAKSQLSLSNEIIDYAADMNIALSYMNCIDDWQDDRNVARLVMSKTLSKDYILVKSKYPRQCGVIERCLTELSEVETSGCPDADTPAKIFGELLSELFIWQEDALTPKLRAFGDALGRAVYIMDAAVDMKRDLKNRSYNPLVFLNGVDVRCVLDTLLSRVSESYEALGITKYKAVFDNVIYSGIWTRYEISERKGARHRGR